MKRAQKIWAVCLLAALGAPDFSGRCWSIQVASTNSVWLGMTLTNASPVLTIYDTTTNGGGPHDIFVTTNLMMPDGWTWLARCAPGQTNLVVTNSPPIESFFMLGLTNAIRPGFTDYALPPEDDSPSLLAALPLTVNFYGNWFSNVWVNENGNVTFNNALATYTPQNLNGAGDDIIAPYWADVDSRNPASEVVTCGTNVVDGHAAFGVDWVNVGYYSTHADRLLSCQLVVIDRSDVAAGDFDMELNYFKVQWEWGDASVGYPARAGFSDGGANDVELPGSGVEGAFMDTNVVTGLIYNSLNSPVPGRYVFHFRDGIPGP